MIRMVWGTPGGSFNVSSRSFATYYRAFGLVYGVWLIAEVFEKLVEPEFNQECRLIDEDAYNVWLAIVIGGLARRNAFPRLVTEAELQWREPEAPEKTV
jgi:hypothetical protein